MKETKYLGIGKNTHNSNATLLKIGEEGAYSWDTYINERLDRKKWSGQWPIHSLLALNKLHNFTEVHVSDNRDITSVQFQEGLLNKTAPFYEMLELKGLRNCTSHYNDDLLTMAHHPAHAYALLATLPYERAYLLIRDGGGTLAEDYSLDSNHDPLNSFESGIEHTSFYFWDGSKLHLLDQQWLCYQDSSISGLRFSQGIGSVYEKAAEFIFNDGQCSGKVMGLAGFGKSSGGKLRDYPLWQEHWPWEKRFNGGSKKSWQEDQNLEQWQNLASEVQSQFEYDLFSYLEQMIAKYTPLYGEFPLAMAGGCALNCTANFKLYKSGLFPKVYISPFPGDESISLGCAFGRAYLDKKLVWSPRSWPEQKSNFSPTTGDLDSVLEKLKDKYQVSYVEKEEDLLFQVASILETGEVIAWFQGASECGPRALGHRSLLARADQKGLKSYLNDKIKFREEFRPYGASVIWEEGDLYFDVDKGFQNPFMSFTTPIKSEYRQKLAEVMHIDGTCRMQTVMREQNQRYYDLLISCKRKFNFGVLLNTSLNIMGMPILEGYSDALDFFEQSEVKYLILEDYIIKK